MWKIWSIDRTGPIVSVSKTIKSIMCRRKCWNWPKMLDEIDWSVWAVAWANFQRQTNSNSISQPSTTWHRMHSESFETFPCFVWFFFSHWEWIHHIQCVHLEIVEILTSKCVHCLILFTQVQSVVEVISRTAIFVWKSCDKVGFGTNHRKHTETSRSCRLFNEWFAIGIWCDRTIDSRMQNDRSTDHRLLPSSWHRRIHSKRRHAILICNDFVKINET